MREILPDAIRDHGEIRFRSQYHYAVFEFYRSAKVLKQLERAGVKVSGRILDAGCGGGGIAVSFAEECELAVGLDIAEKFRDAGVRLAAERESRMQPSFKVMVRTFPFERIISISCFPTR